MQCNTHNLYTSLSNESDSFHFVIGMSEAVDNGCTFWTCNVGHALRGVEGRGGEREAMGAEE